MGFSERMEERRKAERASLRAKEREEQRQEELRELERELEREQERREEAQRIEREFREAEQKSREKAAAFRARYVAQRKVESLRAEHLMVFKRERLEARRETARSEAKQMELRELREQEIRDARRSETLAAEQTGERRARLSEERKETALLDAKQSEYQAKRHEDAKQAESQEKRRQEYRKNKGLQMRETEQSQEREARQSGPQKETRLEAKQAKLRERRRQESREDRRPEKREHSSTIASQQRKSPSGQRFPSGRLSGSLPWLRVKEKYLLDEMDHMITLRGITAVGLERVRPVGQSFPPPLDGTDFSMLHDWGVTALALPIAQDLALEGRDDAEGEDYLEAIDATIEAAAESGIYTIIRLSLLSSMLPTGVGPGGDIFDPALPDQRSIDLWAVLARRYSNEPAVIFDLFRNPHDIAASDSTSFLVPRFSWSVWRHWLLAMLGEIKREHPRALIIARGPSFDMSGFPLVYSDGSRAANIIYATEITPSNAQQVLVAITKLTRAGCASLLDVKPGPFDGRFVERLGDILARGGVHWLTLDWKDSSAPLIKQRLTYKQATPLGHAFQVALHEPPAPDANFEPGVRMDTYSLIRTNYGP